MAIGLRTSVFFLVALLLPASADAQIHRRISVRGELGAGMMLADYQRDVLDETFMLDVSATAGIRVVGPVVLTATYRYWYAPSDDGGAQQETIAGGLRLEPLLSESGIYLVADANAGVGLGGGLSRFAIDASLGVELEIARFLAIGPFARYGHTFHAEGDAPSDAQMVVFGLAVTARGASARTPPP